MCDDVAAVGIQHHVQFAPAPAGFDTMLFLQPLASAVDLQPCAIDQGVEGPFFRDAIIVPLVRRSRFICTTAQGRVIGNGEMQPHQLQHRGQEAFGLPQPQAEYQSQRQGSLNRQIGIARLATARPPLRRLPGRKCLGRHPKHQAATSAKTSLILCPVRNLELHLANTMAAEDVVFERHRCATDQNCDGEHLRHRP